MAKPSLIARIITCILPGLACLTARPAWADVTNTAHATYRDSGGTVYTLVTNTVSVPVNSAVQLPPPTLNLPVSVPVNAQIQASEPANYVIVSYSWSIVSLGPNASSAKGFGSSAQAPTASFTTASGAADLAPHGLAPGAYLITVTATDANNNVSPPAQANVTLVPVDFANLQVYPNPWRSDRNIGKPVTFNNLTMGSVIKIFTTAGHWVKTLIPALNSVQWDLTNDSGDRVASGLYVYLITNDQGQKSVGKLAVIH